MTYATARGTIEPAIVSGRVESMRLGSFQLDDGSTLPELTVAYRHDGPSPGEAPQILVVHALTGSADAAGDWWEPLIGPSRALDTCLLYTSPSPRD